MHDESGFTTLQTPAGAAKNTHLLKVGLEKLEAFAERQQVLRSALRELGEIRDEATRKSVVRLQHQLATLEPSVTMIGQVKAGKTSLINAMIGWPGLLPADVNPWTSVVTSLHVGPGVPKSPVRARFQFFDKDEWTRLLDKGGRIGELASRAGADDELEKIREQVESMREKSVNRLGRRFEMLMGQQHEFNSFDEKIVERYVCLGDDFGEEPLEPNAQGRFADITKSADLYFQREEFPIPLCIRDTPGVNDTFMMREQITIRAIRDSRICVVVLSAHQALSSVDMALIRLIANIKSREVIIFVNRIDELSDPARQVPEIRDSIRETLKAHNAPDDVKIIFGSAYWANNALEGSMAGLVSDSRDSLLNWAESELSPGDPADSPLSLIWQLSGMPALYDALSERIVNGPGQEAIERIARSTNNLATGLQAAGLVKATPAAGALVMDSDEIAAELDAIEKACTASFDGKFDELLKGYHARLDRSHRSFVDRATASLVSHLERHGDKEVWKYDPTGLRLLLRSAYQVFSSRLHRTAVEAYADAAEEVSALFGRALGQDDPFRIEPPLPGHIPPPVIIGQTIALDIQGNWWRKWWQRRRGYRAFSKDFFNMIVAETNPIVEDLKQAQADLARNEMLSALHDFFAEQRAMLLGLADADQDGSEGIDAIFGSGVTCERFEAIRESVGTLMKQAA